MDKQLLKCSAQTLFFFLVMVTTVASLGPLKPMPIEFAISRLSKIQQEQFVDEHNKFRSLVNPPAANMEYMFWNEDLGNLAQMWANKCTWDHGFLEFGELYPNPPFRGQVGQNLAREWRKLQNPADRVKLWYKESSNYAFSKFFSPMVPRQCSNPPCKLYTQLVWATTRFLGCGVSFCEKSAGVPHPWVRGGTEVVCDYAPGGNLIDEFPYEIGKPCSKCASGKGFCYKNLCRDCDDFDAECGRSLTLAMCTGFKDIMAKKCPKMCNLCECPLECQNGGKLDAVMCTCACLPGYVGLDCSEEIKGCPPEVSGENCQFHCLDKAGLEVCHWRISNGHQCSAPYMQQDCAASCGIRGFCMTPSLKPSKLLTTPKPLVTGTSNASTTTHPAYLPVTTSDAKPLGKTSTVTLSSNATARKPAFAASVVTSNNSTNVTLSIGHVDSPNVNNVRPVAPSRKFTNVTVGRAEQLKGVIDKLVTLLDEQTRHRSKTNCKNENPICTLWSTMGKCKDMTRLMSKHCCATGKKGMDIPAPKVSLACKDNNVKCPFWALAGECSRDRIWMQGNCRKSCNQCGVCQDKEQKCADLALLRKCTEGDKRLVMLRDCPQSCGLCQVYDRYDYCPAWAAQGECKKSNWTWMRDNCPLSCSIPLSEVQFCGSVKDGNYPIPQICTGYVSCLGGITRHKLCPSGTLFNPLKKFCDLPVNVRCSQEKDLTLKRNHVAG